MASMGVFSKNVVTTAAVSVVGLITSLGISVLIARVLGPEGRHYLRHASASSQHVAVL